MLRPISASSPLVLGSGSPRRRELLAAQRIPLDVRAPDADEAQRPGEAADAYLRRVTRAKLDAVRAMLGADEAASRAAILVADTIVLDGEEILGKPTSDDEAASFMRRLSGRAHQVRTSFAVGGAASSGEPEHTEIVRTAVTFRALREADIAAYVALGEGRDKAGGYAVQGAGAALVSRIEGSYTNVVGLPVAEVIEALESLGIFRAECTS